MKQLFGWIFVLTGLFLLASCAVPGKIIKETEDYKIYCQNGQHYIIQGTHNKGHWPCDCEK